MGEGRHAQQGRDGPMAQARKEVNYGTEANGMDHPPDTGRNVLSGILHEHFG